MRIHHLLVSSAMVLAFSALAKPCLADVPVEAPKQGVALQFRMPVEASYMLDAGGSLLLGYRFSRVLAAASFDALQSFPLETIESSPYHVPSTRRLFRGSATVELTFARSASRLFEALVIAEASIGREVIRSKGTSFYGPVDATFVESEYSIRLGVGMRYWMSPHFAIGVPLGLRVEFGPFKNRFATSLWPGLMGVF